VIVDRHIEANRAVWDEWTELGLTPAAFKVESFKRGEEVLRDFEIAEVGQVQGRSMLHLQCHFGLDSLAWARRGAHVTGVDFSSKAVERGRRLAEQLKIDARFVCSDVTTLPEVLDERFDIVYTTLGVLQWLPDLDRWAEIVARFLEPGGLFYLAEYHPITLAIDPELDMTEPRFRYPYFPRAEPIEYRRPDGVVQYGWSFSLGAVVSAIARAGFRIEFLHEFPYSESQHLPFLEPDDRGLWWLPERLEGELPLLFSIRAIREG
jgi:SAM-dependent methyltransferase